MDGRKPYQKGVIIIKHGKRPSKKQSIFIKQNGLNPDDWLITKDTPEQMELVHKCKSSGATKIIQKEKKQ